MGEWDDELVAVPEVLWIGDQYAMWYGGCDGTLCRTGYAASAAAAAIDRSTRVQPPDRLEQNYPNPFNPSTTIEFFLSEPAVVELAIFDVQGRRVKTLVNEMRSDGIHREAWDSRNDRGSPVGSGIYYCRLKTGRNEITKKATLLK